MSYGKNAFMMLLGTSFVLYLFGYDSIGSQMLNTVFGGNGFGSYVGILALVAAFFVASTLAAGGASAIANPAAGSSFSVIYTIPLAIAGILSSIIFLPLSFVNEVGFPSELSSLIFMFFGALIFLSFIDLILGRDF